MMRNLEASGSEGWQLNGRHVLGGMVGFFTIILLVNGVFLYSALSTHTGVVASEPYRKGLAYNDRIAADERQGEQGWSEQIALTPDGRLDVRLFDKDKAPIRGLVVNARVGRPVTAGFDIATTLKEIEAGDYAADLGKLSDGSWIVSIEVLRPDDETPLHRFRRRLWLRP